MRRREPNSSGRFPAKHFGGQEGAVLAGAFPGLRIAWACRAGLPYYLVEATGSLGNALRLSSTWRGDKIRNSSTG